MKGLLLAICLWMSASLGADQIVFQEMATRPFAASDLVGLDRVSDFAVSLNGKTGVFSRWTFNQSANQAARSLWLLDIDSTGAENMRPLTLAEYGHSDTSPFWLSDDEIGFVRDDKLLSVQISTGRISPLTRGPIGFPLSNFKYHPQSGMLAFTAEVYANEHSSLENTAEIDAQRAQDHSSVQVFDKLYFRHWDQFDNHKNSHIFTVRRESDGSFDIRQSVNLLKGLRQYSCPIPPMGDASHFVFSPSGDEIAFASMAQFDKSPQAWSTETHIYLVSRATPGQVACLTCTLGVGAKSNPAFSPDGKFIAFTLMHRPQFEADKNNLVVFDRQTKRFHFLTEKLDRSVGDFTWSNDGKAIYFYGEEFGQYKLWSVDLATSEITELNYGGSITDLSTIPGSDKLVMSINTMNHPTEYFIFDPATKSLEQRSSIHTQYLSKIEVSQAEKFWYTGAMGERVMGWILKPVGFDPAKKYPLAYLIHGGPQSSWSDSFSTRWNPQVFAGAGYAVAMVNFHGSTGYGQAFVDSITRNWGGHPYEDVMKGLDYVLEQNSFIDSERIAGLGASYGGFMINWLNGHTDRFACLVNHDGLFDVKSMYYTTEELYFNEYEFGGAPFQNMALYDKWNPSNHVANWKTPTLVIHGGKDYRVPQGEGFSTFTALQRQGIRSKLLFFPDENHWVLKPANSMSWYKEVMEWISEFTQ